MKTTVRADAPERRLPVGSSYLLQHLDNEDELSLLIKKFENKLLPCTHCGHPMPSIRYEYRLGTEEPHRFHAWCCGKNDIEGVSSIGCWMRSFEWRASDADEDIDFALNAVVSQWNRRPGVSLMQEQDANKIQTK